jgi:hypothetical protein
MPVSLQMPSNEYIDDMLKNHETKLDLKKKKLKEKAASKKKSK